MKDELEPEGNTEANAKKPKIPFRERVACSIDETCEAGGFGRTTAYGVIADGRLKTKKLGKRTLVLVDSLVRLLED